MLFKYFSLLCLWSSHQDYSLVVIYLLNVATSYMEVFSFHLRSLYLLSSYLNLPPGSAEAVNLSYK